MPGSNGPARRDRGIDLLLRFAAGRWAAAGHPDPYREWCAELSAADPAGRLRFAASLAVARIPAAGNATVQERWAGRWAAVVPVLTLMLLPAFATLLISLQARFLTGLVPAGRGVAAATGAVLLAGSLLLLVVAGRALGRARPVTRAPAGPYRTVLTVLVTLTPLVLGCALVLAWSGRSAPSDHRLAGVLGWGVLLVPLTVLLCSRGRRTPWRRRLAATAGGYLATAVGVSVAALPALIRVPGALAAMPLWLPAALLAHSRFALDAPGPGWVPSLTGVVGSMPALLLAATALGLPYSTAAARSVAGRGEAAAVRVQTAAAAGDAPPLPTAANAPARRLTGESPAGWHAGTSRVAGWAAAVVGAALWSLVTGWGTGAIRPLAEWLGEHRDADDRAVLLVGMYELRQLAIVVTGFGVLLATRRRGPAWPVLAAVPAALVVDAAFLHWPGAGPAGLLAATVSLCLFGLALLVQRRVPRGEPSRHRNVPVVVAVVTSTCLPAVLTRFDPALPAPHSLPLTVVCTAFGIALGALAAYCVGLAAGWNRAVRLLVVLAAAALFGAWGLLGVGGGAVPQWLRLTGPGLAVLAVLLAHPRPWRRWALAAATIPLGVGAAAVGPLPSIMIDLVTMPAGADAVDSAPAVPGALLLGMALAAALRPWYRPPATAPAGMPSPPATAATDAASRPNTG
ncbi:hypothetical protein AB0I55_03155 [Actinocatenispora sera]|uniref:hypothetical protein n=1 Tax=Actinocatenispora sera TaxID=390989 RepID=UPI0033C54FDC